MRAIAFVVAVFSVSGCEKQSGEDLLSQLPYWKWVHSESKDALTDSKFTSAVLKSGPVSDGAAAPAEMHFRCSGGKMDFYISWNRYVGSDPLVDTRVDNDMHEPSRWHGSADGKTTFYPFFSASFLDRLSASKSYVARVSAPAGEITAKFDTSKVLKETKGIRDECSI